MRLSYCAVAIALLLFSCKREDITTDSPTLRERKAIESLQKELSSHQEGWLMYYFPKTDSLLYSNVSQHLRDRDHSPYLAGYGGFCFALKFAPDGTLSMLSDRNEAESQEEQMSNYSVRQGSSTTLSFTSYNYIHNLVDAKFEGKTDFIYVGKNLEGDLLFKTNSYVEPAREYIWLRKVQDGEDWKESIKRALDNRQHFEQMNNPQIVIRRGERVFFRSDYQPTSDRSDIQAYQDKRYKLFLYAAQPSYYSGAYPSKVNGLGSGYSGTDRGLAFFSGIRWSKDYSFYKFERQGDKFVARLMRTFDRIERRYKYVSHLEDPSGEETGIIAEIYDATE